MMEKRPLGPYSAAFSLVYPRLQKAMTTALTSPPNTPGMPCRLCIPQVSQSPMRDYSLGVRKWKPRVEMMPATTPMSRAIAGQQRTPLDAPMATPPARVALRMSSMTKPWPKRALTAKVERQLPVSESRVLMKIWFWSQKFSAPTPKLKEGQNIHRKRVPIMPKMNELQLTLGRVTGAILLLRIQLTVRPKQAPKLWISMLPPTSSAPTVDDTNTSLKEQPMTSTMAMTSSSLGPTLPMTPPKEMRTAATQYDPLVMMSCSRSMQCSPSGLPLTILSQKGLKRMQSWMTMALMKKVQERADSAWVFMKVIKKPKPMSIITLTSWKTGQRQLISLSSVFSVLTLTKTAQNIIIIISAAMRSLPKVLRELVGCYLAQSLVPAMGYFLLKLQLFYML